MKFINEILERVIYKVIYTDLDNEVHAYEWEDYREDYITIELRPFGMNGLRVKDNDKYIFIPWPQIKQASYVSEEIVK
jgi:hypothetical protein